MKRFVHRIDSDKRAIVKILRETGTGATRPIVARTCQTDHFVRFTFAVDLRWVENRRIL
jgi:hypothetical protein